MRKANKFESIKMILLVVTYKMKVAKNQNLPMVITVIQVLLNKDLFLAEYFPMVSKALKVSTINKLAHVKSIPLILFMRVTPGNIIKVWI